MRSCQIGVVHMYLVPLAQLVLWLQANPSAPGQLCHPGAQKNIRFKTNVDLLYLFMTHTTKKKYCKLWFKGSFCLFKLSICKEKLHNRVLQCMGLNTKNSKHSSTLPCIGTGLMSQHMLYGLHYEVWLTHFGPTWSRPPSWSPFPRKSRNTCSTLRADISFNTWSQT